MTEYEADAAFPNASVIPREGGESSTPQLLDLTMIVSAILDRPAKPDDDSAYGVADTPFHSRG
jgi:hypothetical protein